jgi:radical SAM protein with 4Fe4S-binding SPASM domain
MAVQLRATEGGTPWCIKPELSEGCTRACSFCGINAIRSGPGGFKWMTHHTARRIAEGMASFAPKARVEFAGHGEPLSNPMHLDIIKIFRAWNPKAQLMMTTSGDTIKTVAGPFQKMQRCVDALFEAGITFILLDTYYPNPNHDRLRDEAQSLTGVTVVDYFKDWAPIGKAPYQKHSKSSVFRTLVMMDDLLARNGENGIRLMDSHAGCNPLQTGPDEPLPYTCGRPFRDMVFNHQGELMICCDDWQNKYVIGSIWDTSMATLWAHPRMEAARARLMNKDRNFGPCVKCDVGPATRVGLLPSYGPLTEEQRQLTEETTRVGNPLIQVQRKKSV